MLNGSMETSPPTVQTSPRSKRKIFRKSTSEETTKYDAEFIKTAFLEALYNDDSNESSLVTEGNIKSKTTKHNVELFGLETHLSLADQYNSGLSQSKIPAMVPNVEEGKFIACEKLLKENYFKERDFTSLYDVTKSNAVHCCETMEIVRGGSEKMFDEKALQSFQSPSQSTSKKSIVEAILKDFCSSPYMSPTHMSPEQQHIRYLERTPRFKLLHKPTRVYGRRKKTTIKTDLAEDNLRSMIDNASVNESSDSINSLISSPLSMQDGIQPIKDNLEILMPNNNTSQPLCDNLLTLRTYFTQNSESEQSVVDQLQDILPDNDMFPTKRSGHLLEQVVTLRNKYSVTYDRNGNSCEEFKGFSSGHDSDLCLPNATNSLDDTIIESDILKLSAECLLSPVSSLDYESLNEEMQSLANNSGARAHVPDHKQSDGKNLERVGETDSVIKSTKYWYENDDDDDEFFATFTTQDVVLGSTKIKVEDTNSTSAPPPTKFPNENTNATDNFVGFKTANGNNVHISEESKKRVEYLLKDFNIDDDATEIENHLKAMKSKYLAKRKENDNDATITPTTRKDSQKLKQQPTTTTTKAASIDSNASRLSERNYYSGFKMANGSVINISERAKKNVEHILRDCELKDDFNELLNLKQKLQSSHKTKCATAVTAPTAICANCDEDKEKYENEKNEMTLFTDKRMQLTANKNSVDNREIQYQKSTSTIYMNKSIIQIEQQHQQQEQQQQQQPQKHQQRSRRLTSNVVGKFDSHKEAVDGVVNEQECKQIITRKNLLSLSVKNKRRLKKISNLSENNTHNNNNVRENGNGNGNVNENENAVEYRTPLKNAQTEPNATIKKETIRIDQLPSSSSSSTTPNIVEFFTQATQTSTPFGVTDNGQQKQLQQQQQNQCHQNLCEIDSGLKLIPWSDDNNDSNQMCSSQYSHCSPASTSSRLDEIKCDTNKTLTPHSQQHTLRERLLLLEMYGDASNLSPIVLRNQQQQQQQEQHYKIKGRTFGLKRPRNSLLRKT